MIITPFYAALFALLYGALSINIIRLRFKYQVSLGAKEIPKLERAIRAHGNFSEYIPFILLLTVFSEMLHAPQLFLHLLCSTLFIGRLLHAYCLCIKYKAIARQAGILITLGALASVACVILFLTF